MGLEGPDNTPPPAEEPVDEIESLSEGEKLNTDLDEIKKECEETLVETYGSIERAQKYANIEKTQNIMHPNPNAGMEENLHDKIVYARGYLSIMQSADQIREDYSRDPKGRAKGDVFRLKDSLLSLTTTGKKNFLE